MSISPKTQECFNKVLSHSLRTAASDILNASTLTESAANDEDITRIRMSRVMLTIAAINFRIHFLLHYKDGAALRGLLKTSLTDESLTHLGQASLEPYFLEMGNRFCGEAKRLCYEGFDHLGMSTPCLLSQSTTLRDMRLPHMIHEGHVRFNTAEAKTVIAGSVFVYSLESVSLDLNDTHFAEQKGLGELEFF
jgi:hypothetical protein